MIELDAELVQKITLKGKRLDDRTFDDYRRIVIETGVVTSAEGSCRVKLGATEVVAGVKIEPGTPFPDTPAEGVLMVNAEFVPLASSEFEPGPPSEKAIELARVVDRTIRESKAINFTNLCIAEGEKVWMVYVDIDILDHDGNLIDAASLAAAAALTSARMSELDENKKLIEGKKGSQPLPLAGIPLATTFVKIGNVILADPTLAEEHAADARLTVGTINSNSDTLVSAMQKGGNGGFTEEEIADIVGRAKTLGDQLRKLVK